ncbi:peptide-methionine (S)-S-oxide reductase [Nocardia salmonicida]|uniref:peptide-methionine (S)-S-oxide reductase n=1 Tax=Nocardia salmonicida TaxID=53431 RepID=UPI0007A40743
MILEFSFQIHDPTTENRQRRDFGSADRSAIFYRDDQQIRTALGRTIGVELRSVARQGRHRSHSDW